MDKIYDRNSLVSSDKIRCIFANIRSIKNSNKFEELRWLVFKNELDIIGISESWLNDDVDVDEYVIKGYKLYRKDRCFDLLSKKRGGGVMLFVRDSIRSVEISNDGISETLWVKLWDSSNRMLVVAVCYRSPNSNIEEDFELYEIIKKNCKNSTLIMGDFNYPNIDWVNCKSDSNGSDFLDLINDLFLLQNVSTPTRKGNILDLILSTENDLVSDLLVASPIDKSDHCAIFWSVPWKIEYDDNIKVIYNYYKGDYRKMINYLIKDVTLNNFISNDVEVNWLCIKNCLIECRDRFVPTCKQNNKDYPKWMSSSILKAIKSRNRLWSKFKVTGDYNTEKNYKTQRNKVTDIISKAKYDFELRLVKNIKTNSKAFYSYIKHKNRGSSRIGPLEVDGCKIVSDDKLMCNILNNYFASVFTKENMENFSVVATGTVFREKDCVISDLVFTLENVNNAINMLKDNKSAGSDDLGSSLIKGCRTGIVKPLLDLFTDSLNSGEIPIDWKEANVCPLFKKGSKKLASNYRPVSLTSHVSKIMERIIKYHIVSFIESNNLINDSQHGFREKKSCLTNLLEFLEVTTNFLDIGEPVDVLYLDFAKAFDKVPHQRLLYKLREIGITGKLHNWIAKWLIGRRQRVRIGNQFSDWEIVHSGVPQGSVLGPLLFVIFINDLDLGIVNNLFKFADDVKLLGSVSSVKNINQVKEDLNKLITWSDKWQMMFNIDKCKVMHLGYNNPKVEYLIKDKILDRIEEEKDLGVIISENFKVAMQCHKAAKKGNQVLGMISRSFKCKNAEIIKPLYKSLVRPHLDYCVQAWRPHLQKDISILESVQRRATRMIYECKTKSYEERLNLLRLTTLETRRLRADLLLTFKILNGLEGIHEDKVFKRRPINVFGTRGHKYKLFKSFCKLDVKKFSFGNRVINEWNSLPDAVVNSVSINDFKGKLDHHLALMRGFI